MNKESVCVFDIGTNTVLALACRRQGPKVLDVFFDEQEVVRLGQGVDKTRKFAPEALDRLEKCLKNFKRKAQEEGISRFIATATSAARDAKNKDDLFKIFESLDIPVKIISGKMEAELTFLGAFDKEIDRKLAVVDVGGGSTELIVGDHLGVELAHSFDIGAVRLTEQMFYTHPITSDDFEEARKHVKAFFEPVVHLELDVDSVISVAGTPTSLAAMSQGTDFDPKKVHGFQLTTDEIMLWAAKLAQMSVEDRKQLAGLDEGRADVIVAGTLILGTLIQELNCVRTSVSIKGLRYGVAKHFDRVYQFGKD